MPAPEGHSPAMGAAAVPEGFHPLDPYDLDVGALKHAPGVLISGMCDQRHLARHREHFDAFLRTGGRMLVNGHVVEAWVTGLPKWRLLEYHGPRDLGITSLSAHPVWDGIDVEELLYRSGPHIPRTREALTRFGVAGFYGRGYLMELPEGSTIINGLGPLRAPIDVEIPVGDGLVVVHAGLDLAIFAHTPGTTLTRFTDNIRNWLGGAA
ncbi:hypothetical protein [Actinomyces ruminis]|uniref:Uncharacterized protein n=1 Tax=Actinomyces ruminis TaxID=1937003 RepID=A0ABX4M9X3_9ACTO|nr:hypothetical protein [Actinomyces ruminis]PHP51978.1 hypothetical protein BW737_012945 [Actinomyces ruminis]